MSKVQIAQHLYRTPERDGKRVVKMSCPKCLTPAYLDDHEIAEDGTVTPSVECPKCGWHEHVRLMNWHSAT